MQKFQIQLVIGPYTVNHITEGESKEEVYNWVKEEFLFHKHSESQLWERRRYDGPISYFSCSSATLF